MKERIFKTDGNGNEIDVTDEFHYDLEGNYRKIRKRSNYTKPKKRRKK